MKMVILLLLAVNCNAAMFLNGTTASVERLGDGPQTTPFSPSAAITIAFWIRRTSTNYAGLVGHNVMDQGGGSGNHTISINNTKTNRIDFQYQFSSDASEQTFSTGPNALSATNVWTHVAFSYTYATASSAKFYINGLPVSGSWTTGTGGGAPFTTAAAKERIGFDNNGHFLAGEIADYTLFYQQALNSREILLLASKVKGVCQQLRTDQGDGFSGRGPVLFWPLNQYPSFTTTAPTNSALDATHFFRPATPLNGAVWTTERVQSYFPNE